MLTQNKYDTPIPQVFVQPRSLLFYAQLLGKND